MQLAHEFIGDSSAPSLVLIHGITESRHMWHPLLHSFAAQHKVLAVDLRGHGESDLDDGYDPISYATDVVETAVSLGLTARSSSAIRSAASWPVPWRRSAPSGVINIDQPLRLSGFKACSRSAGADAEG